MKYLIDFTHDLGHIIKYCKTRKIENVTNQATFNEKGGNFEIPV